MYKISRHGVALIKHFEGFRSKLYKDVNGNFTIGYGHKCSLLECIKYKIKGITEEDAIFLMLSDLECPLRELSKIEGLNQDQVDALASFIYNIGVGAFHRSPMRQALIEKKWHEAAEGFLRWVYAKNGKMVAGLLVRRKSERWVFLRSL